MTVLTKKQLWGKLHGEYLSTNGVDEQQKNAAAAKLRLHLMSLMSVSPQSAV